MQGQVKVLSKKQLRELTQAQLKSHAKSHGVKETPNKWTDKEAAVNWILKNVYAKKVGAPAEEKPAKKADTPKAKTQKPKKEKKEKTERTPQAGRTRREEMVKMLRKKSGNMTATELAEIFDIKYKSVLDDVHAIRHSRGGVEYLEKGEILLGAFCGRSKVFTIVDKNAAKQTEELLKETIEIFEEA